MMNYKQGKDLNEKKVNEILKEGYLLHSVTPVYFQHRESRGAEGNTTLIYHFVWDYSKTKPDEKQCIMEIDTLMSDMNGINYLNPNNN